MRFHFFMLLLVLLFPLVAAEEPPSLDNEQFYGTVLWDKNATTPQKVVAKVNAFEYTSFIKDPACTESCSGKYGFMAQNILRVQGKTGDKIFFFVDAKPAGEVTYESGKSVLKDFDLRTVILPAAPCTPAWDCKSWSSCTNKERSRLCIDTNKCVLEQLNKTETESCDVSSSKDSSKKASKDQKSGSFPASAKCTYNWECGEWSSCIGNVQTRTCMEINKCDLQLKAGKVSSVTKYPKPMESRACVTEPSGSVAFPVPSSVDTFVSPQPFSKKESCVDGVKNQNEEDVDCGGVCTKCPATDYMVWVYSGLILIVVVGIAGGVYFILKSRRSRAEDVDTDLELRSAYDRGMARGLSEEEVTQKLVARGWDEALLESFLRRNR